MLIITFFGLFVHNSDIIYWSFYVGNFSFNDGKNISYRGKFQYWQDFAFLMVKFILNNGALIPCLRDISSTVL